MNKDDFFALALEPEYEAVETPIGMVHVKRLNAGERDTFDVLALDKTISKRAAIMAFGVYDDRGMRIFDKDDIPRLETLPVEVTDPIVMAFVRVNRLTEADRAAISKNLNGQLAPSS